MSASLPTTIARFLAASALAWGLSLAAAPAAAEAAAPAVQSSAANGVTVKVTARNIVAHAERWSFEVVLDTHSQALDDDLAQAVVLVTDDGRELRPIAWKGTAPGGHHRSGLLEFAAPEPAPASFQLKLQRRGESAPRIFRFG